MKYLLVGLLILGLCLGAYSGIWKQGARKVVTQNIAQEESHDVYLEVIWDASGSMWGREYGVEKIILSKEVLKTLVEEVPASINMGLRIFGARRVGDINDSFLAVPITQNSRGKIQNFITNIKPLGKSPIGLSLKEAVADLEKYNGNKFILLVSDGIENGDIPPREIVDNIKEKGIVLHIIHIGELNNADLQKTLKDIAEMTGGKYFIYKENEEIIPTFKKSE